jgi:hypothetical protein
MSLGQILGIGGGILAGINEFNAAGGGVAGLVGGAAYAVGSVAAAGAIGGVLSGAGAAAGMAGAMGSIGLAAIPVVGWIALAAMAINMISGGKLFGTAWKPTGATTTTLNVSDTGASVSNWIEETKQAALFGGKKTKEKYLAGSADQQAAAEAFFTQEQTSLDAFTAALGVAAAQIVGGSFTTQTDKNGKTTTSDTVLGVTYKDETEQQFAERIQADSFAKVLDNMGIAASKFVSGMQGDADKLLAAVQDVAITTLAAQADIKKGMSLLGDDTSIADVVNEVMKLNNGSEKLADTYVRLQQETQGLHGILDAMGLSINKTGKDFLEFADAAALAAGGIQNLATLADQFSKDFYSSAELLQFQISALTTKVNKEFAALGEDPTESMEKFRKDFEAALPTMTPDQLSAWLQAGVDLANLTGDLKQVSDAANAAADAAAKQAAALVAAKQKYADYEVATLGDAFTQSLVKTVEAENAQIAAVNAMAKAAGLAGASQQDLAYIMTQGSVAMAQALSQLSKAITADIASLYASSNQYVGGAYFNITGGPNAAANAAAKAAEAQAQKLATAYDLLQKLGDYTFASGGDVAATLKAFGLTPDQLAKTLGISKEQVNADIKAAADNDAALAKLATQSATANGLLEDILAAIQGKPLPFDVSKLGALPGERPGTGPGGATYPHNRTIHVGDGSYGGPDNPELVSAVIKTNLLMLEQNTLLAAVAQGLGAAVNRSTAGSGAGGGGSSSLVRGRIMVP